jgi:hypothetical protein
MTTANEKQVGGNHYKKNAIQPWDYIIANGLGYLDGTAIKYITRWKEKGGIEDINKAIHFLEKLKEVYYAQEKEAQIALKDDGPKLAQFTQKPDGTVFFSMEPIK